MKYTDPKTKEVSIACWKDLIQLYNCECESIVKQTQLNFPSLYPTNFEKQKVSLALRVFNEKTVAALRLKGKEGTARFIELVLRMWKMLNVKSNEVGQRLNDPDRFPFSTPDDIRFTFLRDVAHMFKEMDTYSASSNTRVMGLTSDTGNALHVTFLAFVILFRNCWTEV